MNTNRLSRYAFFACLIGVVILGMPRPVTSGVPDSILPTAVPDQQENGYPLKAEGLAKQVIEAVDSPPQPYPVELRVDGLPPGIPGEAKSAASDQITSPVQMVLDDGQQEQVFGVDDEANAYQFVWFNRFTPQASNFPFVLKEIWVMFDATYMNANIHVGDDIDLVVYSDPDSEPTNGATWLATFAGEILAVDGAAWSAYSLSTPLAINDPGDVLIAVINRYVSSGISDLSYPAAIDTTAGQERSWLGWWWSTDPPEPPELPPDGDLILMTGEYAGNWMIRGYGDPSIIYLYLPLVLKDAILPPVPILYDIDNADGDGSYTINWSTSSLATSYTLEEDDNTDFSSPSVAYDGSGNTKAITGKALGNYYYRVRAENGMGYSNWSEIKTASVTQQGELICETHEFGTVGVAWPILPSGISEHFTAENNMLIETVEVMSMLKALFPVNVYVAVGVNGAQLANKTHYVFSNAYTAYTFTKNVSNQLHVGDDIYYNISKAVGESEAWIRWGNHVKLCGR